MPLTRRIPKRGFTNIFRVVNQVVSFEDLGKLPKGAEVTEETLAEAGLIRKGKGPAKLLANGDAAKGITVRGVKMSAGAKQKIESAGGRIEN
jgi:large subunit ribosomal protein L15